MPNREMKSAQALSSGRKAEKAEFGLAASMLHFSLSFNNECDRQIDAERALQLAESGLAEAIIALRSGGDGAIGGRDNPALMVFKAEDKRFLVPRNDKGEEPRFRYCLRVDLVLLCALVVGILLS